MNKGTHLIIKKIGWSKSSNTNWSYHYYDVTIISNDLDLLKLQGIYVDTFGSVENYFSKLREIKDIDVIIDYRLSETELPQGKTKKMAVGNDLKPIVDLLTK